MYAADVQSSKYAQILQILKSKFMKSKQVYK